MISFLAAHCIIDMPLCILDCAQYHGCMLLQAQKEATVEKEAALEAAQAAEQQLRRQLSSSASSSTALREAQTESESLRQQLEESARKYNTVKQARERAMTEVTHVYLIRSQHNNQEIAFCRYVYCFEL